jgi:ribosomal protein S18 acetylase RimI-like enzyme
MTSAPPGAAQQGTPAAGAERAQLRRATADEVPQLSRVLAAAFHHDPVFEWLIPIERKRAQGLQRMFAIELHAFGLARGSVWTSADLQGAALSTEPGKWRLPVHVQALHGPAFVRAFGPRLPRAALLLQRVELRHVRGPHHYFPAIGVAPERQGQGLGSQLMAPTLERCDAQGLPAYLEASTERSAALYQRLGFNVIRELSYGAGQTLRLMLRAPKS